MKSKNIPKKSNHRTLKWVVGLELAAILLGGVILAGLVFSGKWFASSLPPFKPVINTTPSPVSPSSTAVPSHTSQKAVLTAIPTMAAVNFDLSTANRVAPADVLQQIEYFPPEGAEGSCKSESNTQPMLDAEPQPAEWLSQVSILTCGWKNGEPISVTVTHNGSVYATTTIDQHGYAAEYRLPISTSLEIGEYQIAMAAPSGRIETTVKIYLPTGPRLSEVEGGELVLYNFAPNESVRLFLYRSQSANVHYYQELEGWNQVQVDANGMLTVKVPPRLIYYAVGMNSGIAKSLDLVGIPAARSILVSPCGGQPSYVEHIYPGAGSEANAAVDTATFLFSAPGPSYAVVAPIEKGTLVAILEGPACIDEVPWWYIRTGNQQQSGWIPEYRDGAYLLDPYPKETLSVLTSGQSDLEFNPDTANQVPPEDVFEQVTFFGRGAGLCMSPPYPVPVIDQKPTGTELFSKIFIGSCGWEEGETLKGMVQYPDGRSITQYIQVERTGDTVSADLAFTPTLEDPPGSYILSLAGRKGVVSATVEVRQPDGPRIYVTDPLHILLYHFAPQESVRLICYGTGEKLYAWQNIKMDSSGNQLVRVETTDCAFIALGPSSGEVHDDVKALTGTVRKTCGGLMTRLDGVAKARVAFTDGTNKPFRSMGGKVEASLPEGAILSMLYKNPVCTDGSLWWMVYTEDGTLGSVPEEQNGVYLLEPVP